jgi:hypothetical protein
MNPASRQRPAPAAAQAIGRDIGMHAGRPAAHTLNAAEEACVHLAGACVARRTIAVRSPERRR